MERVQTQLYEHKYLGPFLTSVPIRIQVSLYASLFLNLTYVLLNAVTAIIYTSFWSGMDAVFYLVLGIVRFTILRNLRRGVGVRRQYEVFRFCGCLLLVLNLSLTGIVFQTIYFGRTQEYPGLLIFIVAAYAFIFLVNTVVTLFKYRRLNSPIISATKMISLTQAIVAIYSLQIALLTRFGDEATPIQTLNSIVGWALCIIIFAIAIFMIVRGTYRLRRLANISAHPA